jgi:hypothetical protein
VSEFTFQGAFVRLVTDAKARQAVFAGDITPLTELGLSPAQAQQLLTIDRERLEVFSELVFAQRLDDIVHMLPLTVRLLGERVSQIAYDFNHKLTPEYSRRREHALAFARFLKEEFERRPPTPPFLADVLSYEMNTLELYDKRNESDPVQSSRLARRMHESAAQALIVPQRLSHNRALSFNYDVLAIMRQMTEEDRIPAAPVERPCYLLIRMNPTGLIEHDEINFPTLAFIRACDGTATLGAIIESLAETFQQNTPALFHEFKRGCLQLCESLLARSVISLKPREGAAA